MVRVLVGTIRAVKAGLLCKTDALITVVDVGDGVRLEGASRC